MSLCIFFNSIKLYNKCMDCKISSKPHRSTQSSTPSTFMEYYLFRYPLHSRSQNNYVNTYGFCTLIKKDVLDHVKNSVSQIQIFWELVILTLLLKIWCRVKYIKTLRIFWKWLNYVKFIIVYLKYIINYNSSNLFQWNVK